MVPLQNTYFLSFITLFSLYTMKINLKTNWAPGLKNTLNSNMIYGFIILFQSTFGISSITEKPEVIKNITNSTFIKFISLLVITFSAVRDIEDTIFATITFLSIIQLFRTEEERKRFPYIIV